MEQGEGVRNCVPLSFADLGSDLLDRLVLKAHSDQYRLPSVVEVLDAQRTLEVEFGQCGNQVND